MKNLTHKRSDFFSKVFNSYKAEESAFITSFEVYLDKGQENFKHTVILFGEETVKEYDIIAIFKMVKAYYISKSVLEFERTKKYSVLLKGYLFYVYYQVMHYNNDKFAPSILGTDLSLLLMFTLTYFPDETDKIGKQLIKFLIFHKEKAKYSIESTGDFGLSNIVHLSSFLAGHYQKKTLSVQIKSFCSNSIEPCYLKAIENLYSNDEKVVGEWVDDMINFHLRNSKNDLKLPFNNEEWQYFPIEILSMLELRVRKGLKINFIKNKLLDDFIPLLGNESPIELNDDLKKLRSRLS
ncbi:hypothetical protein [uncultured Aquimarina sp.]|uniref:hypothetical protein n=1 Tax=uncultured Aquimarina sp. TaxID=575652 RepID=UPI00262334CE|nr:hypothetical protein [uncultured Aquimarina sp.]